MKENLKSITAFGNPLLDTVIKITNDSLLIKYNLERDGQKEISENEMKLLENDLTDFEKTQTAGGCAQNTLRIMQWVFNKQLIATIVGSVGQDENGAKLKTLLQQDGVETKYISKKLPTGTTVALVDGPNRSLVACLAAAEVLDLADLQEIPALLKSANLVYIEGFFLTKRVKAAKYVADLCLAHQIRLAFNISARYLCELCPKDVLFFAKTSDMLFGNQREFEALNPSNPVQFALDLSKEKTGKIVVITNGHKPIKLAFGGQIEEIPVPPVTEIRDTTGAGDAFVGGFLAGLFKGYDLGVCCKLGCYVAQEIIKREGCAMPEYAPHFEF